MNANAHARSDHDSAIGRPEHTQTVIADVSELESLRSAWDVLEPSYVDADLDYFRASVANATPPARPYVVLLGERSGPRALIVARVETAPFPCRIGYQTVYRPKLSTLRVAHGGIAGEMDSHGAGMVAGAIAHALRSGDAEVAVVPAVRTGSPLEHALDSVTGRWRRQAFSTPYVHRRLVLPNTFDELLAARDRRSRYNLRRQNAQLERAFEGELAIDVLRRPEDFERIVSDLEAVASATYQRALGAGFADTPERRELVRVALAKGWFRAWVLSIRGAPVAFWQGNAVNGTFFVSSTGYTTEFGPHGVGTYLQLGMFADLCADPAVSVVDFGWGDADYKKRFGTESWLERDIVLFGPSSRAVRVAVTRNALRAVDRLGRGALTRLGLVHRIKRLWRQRLRGR